MLLSFGQHFFFVGECGGGGLFVIVVDVCDFAEELAFSRMNLHKEEEGYGEEKDEFCRWSHGDMARER